MAEQSLGTVGLIGAGSLAQAFAHGLLESGRLAPQQLLFNHRGDPGRLRRMLALGARHAARKEELCRLAEIIVLAVKPHDLVAACRELRPCIAPRHLIVSLAAGVPTSAVARALGPGLRIVRAMPNTSSAIGASATAVVRGGSTAVADSLQAAALLAPLGAVEFVEEGQMDAVTALSGSGPAYVYLVLESLIDAGVAVGLSKEIARALVLQTVYGAARMALESGVEPAELRRRVSSPGGTTIAALGVLEEAGVRRSFLRAVGRARERAGDLARGALAMDV